MDYHCDINQVTENYCKLLSMLVYVLKKKDLKQHSEQLKQNLHRCVSG